MIRLSALALVVFVAACGGSKDDTDTTSAPPPIPLVKYVAVVNVDSVVTLDGSGSTTTSGGTLTYAWALTSKPTGSVSTIANPTAVQASLPTDQVGSYGLTLTVSDGFKSQSVPFTVTTVAYTPPAILSDLVEPVSGVVQLSLATDQGTTTVAWTVDGVAIGTGSALSWNTAGLADGSHLVVAQIQTVPNYVVVNDFRVFQTKQTPVSFTAETISESNGTFTAIVGAQSANGIVRIDAALDSTAIGSLAAPNACSDTTGVACASTGPDRYSFTGSVGSGAHVVLVTATDGAGNQLATQLRLNVTDVK